LSEIHPDKEVFEMLKQFCFTIGEGRMEPNKYEVHYTMLKHPTMENEWLLVHYDEACSSVFVREDREGVIITGDFENFPLVHSFNSFLRGGAIFPFVVDLHDEEVTYHYIFREEGTTCIKIPLAQYTRLKLLFDGKNPAPWMEREDPDHTLPPPVRPDE